MKLSLKNIGKIEDASIEINGITSIAGENNTGKSCGQDISTDMKRRLFSLLFLQESMM